ncbi:mCG140561, partial [Mus musculus]
CSLCDYHNKIEPGFIVLHRHHLGSLPWHYTELRYVCQKAKDLLVPGDILWVQVGWAARTRLHSGVGIVMMTDTFATFNSTLYFTKYHVSF